MRSRRKIINEHIHALLQVQTQREWQRRIQNSLITPNLIWSETSHKKVKRTKFYSKSLLSLRQKKRKLFSFARKLLKKEKVQNHFVSWKEKWLSGSKTRLNFMLVGTYFFSTMVTPICGPLFRRFVVFDDVCFSFIAWEKCFSFWASNVRLVMSLVHEWIYLRKDLRHAEFIGKHILCAMRYRAKQVLACSDLLPTQPSLPPLDPSLALPLISMTIRRDILLSNLRNPEFFDLHVVSLSPHSPKSHFLRHSAVLFDDFLAREAQLQPNRKFNPTDAERTVTESLENEIASSHRVMIKCYKL